MKFSLNLLFFFSSGRKKWKSGKGGESEEGRERGRKGVGEALTLFSLSANFSQCQEVAWLRKKKNLFVIFAALRIISYGTSVSSNFSVH